MKMPRSVLYYVLWFVSSVVSIADWIALRAMITSIAAAIGGQIPMEFQIEHQWYVRWTVAAVDPCFVAILTILALVSIIGLDYLYQDAVAKGTIKKRFGIVTAVQASILVVSYVAVLVASRIVKP
jgi:hypothetical protein